MKEIINSLAIELGASTNEYDKSVTKDVFYFNIRKQRTLKGMLDEIIELQKLEDSITKKVSRKV